MTTRPITIPDPETPAAAPRRRYTAAFKRKILKTLERVPEGERGAFLRKHGLYSGTVSRWNREADSATLVALAPRKRGPKSKRDPEQAEVARLRRQVAALEHKLEVAQEIITVQKKISQLLGIELATPTDDETSGSS